MNPIHLLAACLLPVVLCAAELPPEILLWPAGAPGSEGRTNAEVVVRSSAGDVTSVWSVHRPSLTPYLPSKDQATGTALLVIPGGGHRNLAIGHEGYAVAEWLRSRGIAVFVLSINGFGIRQFACGFEAFGGYFLSEAFGVGSAGLQSGGGAAHSIIFNGDLQLGFV